VETVGAYQSSPNGTENRRKDFEMVTNVDPTSMMNIIITANAKPAPFFSPNSVFLHLTKGFSSDGIPAFLLSRKISDVITGSAWSGTSEFNLLPPVTPASANADYGYTQIATVGRFEATYRGQRPQMGQTDVKLGLDGQTFGDWDSGNRPWVAPDAMQRQQLSGNTIVCPMQDHPNIVFPNKLFNKHPSFNSSNSIVNYLYFVNYSISLIAILCARSTTTHTMEPIQFFRWTVQWRFKVKYHRGKPKVTNMSGIHFDTPKAGDPSLSGAERKIFDNPNSKLFNDQVPAALQLAFPTGSSSLQTFRSDWDSDLPKDFFR
jgi:hypothetical protein